MNFEEWRSKARRYLANGTIPSQTQWNEGPSLFGDPPSEERQGRLQVVPKEFLTLAETVYCHSDENRKGLLYRVLFRLTIGDERHLLKIDVDDDVRALRLMEKQVHRDAHKMKAFVRFRRVPGETPEQYIAWHRPDHNVVEKVAPWFAERFGTMRWSILTPRGSAHWDTRKLRYGPAMPQSVAPSADALEDLWRDYYASIFNPARVKISAMKTEMPVRYWATLPEASLIPVLIAEAGERVNEMEKKQKPSAAPFVPESKNLEELGKAASHCRGCELYKDATQTVFGEGRARARVVLIGEQPGDEEDHKGQPFVGPAGRLLNKALEEAGVDRSALYVTNAVKHFKFEPRGKRRIHKKPSTTEITACRPWLEAEMAAIRPSLIVCLGATAARSVYGREVKVTVERGELQPHAWAESSMITVHPSALLRMDDPERKEAEWELFVRDLRKVSVWLEQHPSK